MKKIAIIFLGDFHRDARSINLSNTIIKKGYRVAIISTSPSLSKERLNLYCIPDHLIGFRRYINFHYKAKQILKKINPDIVIAGDLFSLPAACSHRKSKIIYDSREIYSQLAILKSSSIKQFIWTTIEKKYIYRAKQIVVTAATDKEFLLNLYGNLNIVLLKNFPSRDLQPSKGKDLKKQFRLPANSKIFMYQGVLQKDRGIISMIKLLKYFDFANCIIIGDGDYKEVIVQYIKKNNLISRVFFIESVPYQNLLEYTFSADIGFALIKPVTKSYENALPNKIFEYALSNVPFLASDLPEIKKVTSKYNLGYSVQHDDIDGQIRLIEKILSNQYKSINEIALMHFVWEKQTAKVFNLIK